MVLQCAKAGQLVPETPIIPCQLSFLCFLPFILSYSQCLSSLLADSYFLLLTFLSHSLSPHYVLFISLFPFYFSAGGFFFFFFAHMRIFSFTSFFNLCLTLSCSYLCLSLTRVVTVLLTLHWLHCLSGWYAVHSHTWRGTEVPGE